MNFRKMVKSPFVIDVDDRRSHPRLRTLSHLIMHVGGRRHIVSLENIGPGGAAVFTVDTLSPGTAVMLAFPAGLAKPADLNQVSGKIVRLAGTGVYGIAFDPGQGRTVKNILRNLPAMRATRTRTEATALRRRATKPRSVTKSRQRKKTTARAILRARSHPKRR